MPFEFPGTPRVGAIGFTVNNKAYIGGGVFDQDYETDFYELNPATGWKQIGDITEIRYGATAFVVNNTAYLGLGWTKHEEDRIPPYLMKLNQPTGIWQKVQYNKDHDIDALQRADPAIFIIKHDDKEFVYFVGGDKFLSPPNSSWRYNVQQNIWIRERDFPELVYNQIGFTINNRAFIIIPRTYSLDTWEYVLK